MQGQQGLDRQSLIDAVQLAFTSVPEHLLPPGLRGQVPKPDAQVGFAVRLRPNFGAIADEILHDVVMASSVVDAVALSLRKLWVTQLVSVLHPDGDEAAREVERSIAGGTALIFAKSVALEHGARLECGREARRRLTSDVQQASSAALRITVAEYLVPAGPDLPRPRAAVMTALHRVPPEEHPDLLEYAAVISVSLASVGYEVIGPDAGVTPDSVIDDGMDPQEWCEREREIVLAADLVVTVIGKYDSWGSSKVVAWAEANAADALVLDDDDDLPVTRILNATPGRVEQRALEPLTTMTETMRQWGAKHLAHAIAHQTLATQAANTVAAVLVDVQYALAALPRGERRGVLTDRRVVSVMRTPQAFLATTLFEFLAMAPAIRDIVFPAVLVALGHSDCSSTAAEAAVDASPAPAESADVEHRVGHAGSDNSAAAGTPAADVGNFGAAGRDGETLRPMSFRMLELAATRNGWSDSTCYELIRDWFNEPILAGTRNRRVPITVEDWEERKGPDTGSLT